MIVWLNIDIHLFPILSPGKELRLIYKDIHFKCWFIFLDCGSGEELRRKKCRVFTEHPLISQSLDSSLPFHSVAKVATNIEPQLCEPKTFDIRVDTSLALRGADFSDHFEIMFCVWQCLVCRCIIASQVLAEKERRFVSTASGSSLLSTRGDAENIPQISTRIQTVFQHVPTC